MTTRPQYLETIELSARIGWQEFPHILSAWKKHFAPSVLWGYDPPAQPIFLANIFGFLFEETGETEYAQKTLNLLTEFGKLTDLCPKGFEKTRVEYENGIPALTNFFFLPPYVTAYRRISECNEIDTVKLEVVKKQIIKSVNFIFYQPEWGAHNRAMLRAEGLYGACLAFPDHDDSARWKKMAGVLARDNLSQWEVEDAAIYQPVWLLSLLTYAELSGEIEIVESPLIRYCAEYFKRLFTPAATMPDYGDANWNPSWDRYLAVFECLAAKYRDAELKWIANQIFEKGAAQLLDSTNEGSDQNDEKPPVALARAVKRASWTSSMAQAFPWIADDMSPEQPTTGSQEVLEDLVGKKVVFRDGWTPESTYFLLNYRDEGDGGHVHREFLRNTISVEEEKMHHGHADENDITLFMQDGSVLLHDGGYRDGLPSGPFGQYRADYFHNRLVVRKNKRDADQSLKSFIQNSGAYRPVQTKKIDFLVANKAEMSRTRLLDSSLGYSWDRIITFIKPMNMFVVIDAVEFLRTDYYTLATLWHTRTIHEHGKDYCDSSIDAVGSSPLPHFNDTSGGAIESDVIPCNKRLLVHFLQNHGKTAGFYNETRHYQEENAIYQTQSSHYRTGDREVFVTALRPHDPSHPIEEMLSEIRVIPVECYPKAVSLEIKGMDSVYQLCIKIDLDGEILRENVRPRYSWESGRIKYGRFETDAHFLFAAINNDKISYSASEFIRVKYEDRVLIESSPLTQGLQLDGSAERVGRIKWRLWEDEIAV